MRASSHAPFYDLFKLIVAIILLIVIMLINWTQTAESQELTEPVRTSTPFLPTPIAGSPKLTAEPPTFTPITTPLPTDTEAPAQTVQTGTPLPPPTDEPLPTPIVEIPSGPEACAAYSRSQLQVGMEAIIQRRLNFRSFPGLFNNRILTNDPGTEVEIIGGPACTLYREGGAYLWWEIKLPNGLTGWSAEASAFGAFYFMEPIN